MAGPKKPKDTDTYGPTYRPEGSGNHGTRDGMLVEGDDLPETGPGASREKLGDYLNTITSVNKYHPNQGSTEAVSHRDVSGPPPVVDGYKKAGSVNNTGTDQTFLDDVLGHGAVKEKDFTNTGVGEYKNPNVAKGEINPFMLKDGNPPIYNKGVGADRGKGHTLLAEIPQHGTTGKNPSVKIGKIIEPGPHEVQKRTSAVLQNNRFHPSKGSPYITEGAFSSGGAGTMGSNQTILGTYDPEATQFKIEELSEIGRKIMVAGVGHGADGSESLSALLPSLQQMGIPYVTIDVSDLNAAKVGGYSRSSGGYILADGSEGAVGWSDNEVTSKNTFGHLNSYFETFGGVLPMGMITAALGGLLSILIQAAVIYGVISLLMIGADAAPQRRNPAAPWTLPKGKRQDPKGYNALVGPILGWLGAPELESKSSLFECMLRGVGSFFGVPNLDGIPSFGELADMFNALMEQGGFVAGLMRSATRDLEDVANVAAQIRGNAVSIAAGIIGVIKALGSSASIRFLMTCAKLGDLMYLADTYTFAPYNADPDVLPEGGSTRLAKNRVHSKTTQSVLRHGALPSRYLLPLSLVNASLQYELRSGQGHEALASMEEKFAPNDKLKNGRIDPDYVKEIEDMLDCEYVPFYFQDLRTNEIVAFHAFLDSISDDYSPEWSSMGGYGRMDPVQIYNRTTRAISISFMVAATNPTDFDEMWYSINKLTTLVYPQWSAGTAMKDSDDKGFIMPFSQIPAASPILRMRIGDLIKNNYSRFNLARIFGVGHADKAGSVYHQAGNDKSADAEKARAPDQADKNKEYFTKLLTPPENLEDSDNGYQDGTTAIMKSNSGETSAVKSVPVLELFPDLFESMYVEVPTNTVVEVINKDYPGATIIPFLIPPPPFSPSYACKFPADSPMAEVYDGEFYLQHGMLMPDPEQTKKDLGVEALPPEVVEISDSNNKGFMDPEKNAVVRAFESTRGRGLAGVITSLSYDYADAPWETRSLGSRAPMWVKVSVSFTPIHDLPPGLDHDGFNRAPIYNVGNIMNQLSGPDMQNTELGYVDEKLTTTRIEDQKKLFATVVPRDPESNGGK